MEKVFNKLVRDNIPDIIKENGDIPYTSILDDKKYQEELLKKLLEEANEVVSSGNKDELLEELSDVYEVMLALCDNNNITFDDVIEKASVKRNKRGGFSKRIFLIKTDEKQG